jgi:hypothetical protein
MKRGRWKVPATASLPLETQFWLSDDRKSIFLSHLIRAGRTSKLFNDEGECLYLQWIKSNIDGDDAINRVGIQQNINVTKNLINDKIEVTSNNKMCDLISQTDTSIRLSMIADYSGKTRVVSIGSHTIQVVLKQYHKYLMNILKTIPEDCS